MKLVYNDLGTPMPKNALDTGVLMWDTAEEIVDDRACCSGILVNS